MIKNMLGVPAYRRHDTSDKTWKIIEQLLLGRKEITGQVSP